MGMIHGTDGEIIMSSARGQDMRGDWFYDSVDAAVEHIKNSPDARFEFNTNAEGGLDLSLTQHSASVKTLFQAMRADHHSISSINEAFGEIQQQAIEMQRPVTRAKIGGDHYTLTIGAHTPHHA